MHLRIYAIIALVPLVAAASGCKCPSSARMPHTPTMPCSYSLAEADPEPPNLVDLVFSEGDLVPLPAPSETYLLLSANQCQCASVSNATIANLVELERYWAQIIIECDTKNVAENFCLDRDLLSLHASAIRNEAAASALEAFYQLAGLEAQQHYLLLAMNEAEQTLERIDDLREQGPGVPEGIDRTAIQQQMLTLEDRAAQMEFTRIQLNGQLQRLVGCPMDESQFFWPRVDWLPDLGPLDVERALQEGLANRQDLRGLGLVLCNLERHTLPIARGVLGIADATLGSVEPQDGIIHILRCFHCNETELPVRCRQLAMLYDETERGATAEIKNAAYRFNLQQHRVVIAEQSVLEMRNRLRERTETRDVRPISVFELSNLRTEVYEAETHLIEQVVALKLAEVELKKAQGLLSVECGFGPQLCMEGCCCGACVRNAMSQRGVSISRSRHQGKHQTCKLQNPAAPCR